MSTDPLRMHESSFTNEEELGSMKPAPQVWLLFLDTWK